MPQLVDKLNNLDLYAARAVADENGVNIASSYAKKSQLPAAQVNADWDASSGVAQILNKPDLSQYATLSDVTGKQNTLNETNDISLGGQAGGQWPQVRLKSSISGGTNLSGLRHNGQSSGYDYGTLHNNDGPNSSTYCSIVFNNMDPWDDISIYVEDGWAFQESVYIVVFDGVSSWNQVTSETPFAVSKSYYDFSTISTVRFQTGLNAGGVGATGFYFYGYNSYSNSERQRIVMFTNQSYGRPYTVSEVAAYVNTNWNPQSWDPEMSVYGVQFYTSNPVYDAGLSLDPETGPAALGLATVASSGSYNDLSDKPTIPTVPTAGNMLSTTNNVLNVTTTAGITDVQLVQSMPASPVATVLYLIPEN